MIYTYIICVLCYTSDTILTLSTLYLQRMNSCGCALAHQSVHRVNIRECYLVSIEC